MIKIDLRDPHLQSLIRWVLVSTKVIGIYIYENLPEDVKNVLLRNKSKFQLVER